MHGIATNRATSTNRRRETTLPTSNCDDWPRIVISFVFFGLLMISNNLAGNLYVNTTVNAAVEIPAVVVVLFVLDRWGRKPLYFSSVVLAGLACLVSGLINMYLPDNLQWISVLAAMIGKFGASAGFTVIYIFTAELFPTVVRNAGVGASSCVARIGSIVAPYTVDLGLLISSGPIGTAFPMILYGVLSLIAGGLSLYLPETLGKDLPETIADGERFGNSTYTFLASEEDADNNDETDDEVIFNCASMEDSEVALLNGYSHEAEFTEKGKRIKYEFLEEHHQ